MIDDLLEAVLEAAVEIGGEVLEAAIGGGTQKRKGNKKKTALQDREPWDSAEEKSPWEE